MRKWFAVFFLSAVYVSCAAGAVIYVDDDAAAGGDGASWSTAYRFLQGALSTAVSGDEIHVAAGVYRPDRDEANPAGTGLRTASFVLKNGVAVRGGYAGIGWNDPNVRNWQCYECVLSGDLANDDETSGGKEDNTGSVVTSNGNDATTVIDGFVITGGYATGSNPCFEGGGLYIGESSDPTIQNCSFIDNEATWGGGIYGERYNNPKVNNCRFEGNSSVSGGAIYRADGMDLIDCIFILNRARDDGGAIYSADVTDLINCAFTGNHCSRYGGAVYVTYRERPDFHNCTMAGNYAGGRGGAIYNFKGMVDVFSCIVWGNSDNYGTDTTNQIYHYDDGSAAVSYSCVQDADPDDEDIPYGGATNGNIDDEPGFMTEPDDGGDGWGVGDNDETGNVRLSAGSVCIDAGYNSGVPAGTVTDLDGATRFYDDPTTVDSGSGSAPLVDMGAYEYVEASLIETEPGMIEVSCVEGGAAPASIILRIRNLRERVLGWEVVEDCGWLEVAPVSGESSGEYDDVMLSFNNGGLSVGQYQEVLAVTDINAVNSPVEVPVLLSVMPPVKTEVDFPADEFVSEDTGSYDPLWVKFIMKTDEPDTVYFQNSKEYLFHYDFASQWLEPFIGMSVPEFFDVTLYEDGQLGVLGTVIMPPVTGEPPQAVYDEYGIQFTRYDVFAKEDIRDMFNVVKSKVIADPCVKALYFPSYEQLASAEANSVWLAGEGIEVSSPARWYDGNISYSIGWAIGEVKYFDSTAIEAAYLSGALEYDDILLTDGIPAEIPMVAGIMTLAPSTPNSHVAILARTYGIPFVYLADESDIFEVLGLVDQMALMCVQEGVDEYCQFSITDPALDFTEAEIAALIASKNPGPLSIAPVTMFGAYSAPTAVLLPSDVKYFGGKASNYGMLRRSIPDNCPIALGISFDLWDEFMGQTLANGKTLRVEIAERLSGFSYPPANMAALSAALEGIRENLIKEKSATSFTPAQESAILAILQDGQYGFEPDKRIRFRSSTNVEDSEEFTGAGLYDSYSGCLADELDGDETGPCICDPVESKERGVFRAIRKVYASFYNDNAYLERLRRSVDENEVGMAVLVHHSFSDDIELANGVATFEKTAASTGYNIKLVTQMGAVSVSNPVDGSIPEEVSVYVDDGGQVSAFLVRSSNLVIMGDTVMDWVADYNDLANLLVAAAGEFENVTGKSEYMLDFEYKKTAAGGAAMPGGGLVVKQIREIPATDASATTCPIPEACTCQAGEWHRQITYEDENGIFIESSYCLEAIMGVCPLSSWCRTVIGGFTSRPIFLYSSSSQAYSAGHHNWCEDFTFVPTMEPGMDQCLLNELKDQNISEIRLHQMTYCGEPWVETVGGYGPYYQADLTGDVKVDMRDFAKLADWWLGTDCGMCGGADLDCDNEVDTWDVAEFAANWLAGAE